MFDLFSFRCCQNVTTDDIEFDLEVKNTFSSPTSLEGEIKKLKSFLKTKLCLFTIYTSSKELLPFNELKIDEDINTILSGKYYEIYKKKDEVISQNLLKAFSLSIISVVTMVVTLEENNDNFKLIDYLKDEEVTRHNVKKLIKIYKYFLYSPPPEPDEKDPDCCNIIFRFTEDSQTFSRRYNKNVKVKELYNLICSKYPKMPFKLYKISPTNELTKRNNTLEQEKLFPSGIVQVLS